MSAIASRLRQWSRARRPARVLLVGNVDPQARVVWQALGSFDVEAWLADDPAFLRHSVFLADPDLIIVAGWRHLIPPDVLAIPRLGVVGFHSAKLPEYPGRAPVPWALVRGDDHTYNTLLYLDEGVDSGDIIDAERIPIWPGDDPDVIYRRIAVSCVSLLEKHLPAILDGTAPRTAQDPAKRGPLTTKDGWDRWHELSRFRG